MLSDRGARNVSLEPPSRSHTLQTCPCVEPLQSAAKTLTLTISPVSTQDNTHLASRLFGALSVEAPGSRTALQEALGALAGALAGGIQQQQQQQLVRGTAAAAVGVDGARLAEVEELLMSSIKSEQV